MSGLRVSRVVRLLRGYAWRYRWWYVGGAAFLLLTNVLTATIPIELGKAVDALKADESLGRPALLIALMGAGIIVVRTLSRVLIFNPGRYVECNLRQDVFDHLMRLQPEFYATRRVGDLISRLSNDIRLIRAMIGFGGLQVMNVTFAFAVTGWRMLELSPLLTVLVLLPVSVATVVVHVGVRRLFTLQLKNQEQLAEISDHVMGTLQGIATVQGFGAERAFEERLESRNAAWFGTGIRLALVRSLVLPLLTFAGGVALALLVWVGGRMVLAGELTVGQLAAFAALLAALIPPVRSVGWMLAVLQRGDAALRRVMELLDAPVERPEGRDGVTLPAGRGPSIEIRGLEFAYPDRPDTPVLEGIDVDVPAGSVVGVFGRTGSGKTTLLRVLARLYTPPPGTVRIDGVDIRDLDLDAWRERLTVVDQTPFLFSEPLASNIALEENPDADTLDAVIRAAALDADLAALPRGLDTPVGERGVMLSGGQRQRAALARALYRRSDLVLLDDVVSAVDHATEARLVETVARLSRDESSPTVVLASHRLSVLRHADLILVLEDGRLVQRGTHEELVDRPGPYRTGWRLQQLGEDVELEEVAG